MDDSGKSNQSTKYVDPDAPPRNVRYSIVSLRLDMDAAKLGRTWLLLPEGFRDRRSAQNYPLPTKRIELTKVAEVAAPMSRKDAGAIYIRRAQKALKRKQTKVPVAIKLEKEAYNAEITRQQFNAQLKDLRAEVRAATEQVKEQAAEAIASMDELFQLGRRGIAAQMQAHLENKALPSGELISAHAFRECFRMVTQAVKGLGLPTEQRNASRQAVIDQVSASLDATREAIAMAPSADDTDPEKVQ